MQEAEFKNCLTTFTIRHNIPKADRDKVFREIVEAVKANSDHVQITRYEEPQCVFKHMVITYRYTFRSTRSNLDIMRYVLNMLYELREIGCVAECKTSVQDRESGKYTVLEFYDKEAWELVRQQSVKFS